MRPLTLRSRAASQRPAARSVRRPNWPSATVSNPALVSSVWSIATSSPSMPLRSGRSPNAAVATAGSSKTAMTAQPTPRAMDPDKDGPLSRSAYGVS